MFRKPQLTNLLNAALSHPYFLTKSYIFNFRNKKFNFLQKGQDPAERIKWMTFFKWPCFFSTSYIIYKENRNINND